MSTSRNIKFKAICQHDETGRFHSQTYGVSQSPVLPSDRYHWVVKDLQYTGLLDKNNKEIYEDDIADGGTNTVVQVIWSDHHQWGCKVIKGSVLTTGLTFPLWHWDNCRQNEYGQLEVTGTIHENPELLIKEVIHEKI